MAILKNIKLLLQHQVYVGDVLTIYGEVTLVNEACRQIELNAWITNNQGVKVSRAKIKAGLFE